MTKALLSVSLILAAICIAAVYARNPAQREYLAKETLRVPEPWMKTQVVPSSKHRFQIILALKQQNTNKLNEIFVAVSDPNHPKYGQYLTMDQLTALVAPSQTTMETVTKWLAGYGLNEYSLSYNKDFMFVDVELATLSAMLEVEFSTYMHSRYGRTHVTSVEPASVPSNVAAHLDYIVGFNGFPTEPRKRAATGSPKLDDILIGPLDLRTRYNITTTQPPHHNNKQAVAEFQGEFYNPQDLETFIKKYYPSQTNPAYWTATVKGTNTGSNPSTEGSLDIEYIMGVAPGIATEFWSMQNFDFYSDLTRWITWIDQDKNSPWVHSVSYGSQGNYPTADYQARFSTDIQKISVRGISIIFASGDSGTGCWICENFDPSFPAVSPYVTAVGATRFLNGRVGPEGAVTAFSSGGGMSWNDAIPTYQKAAVDGYFNNLPASLTPKSSFYNRNGRGTPDVAALGIGYNVLQGGYWESIGGTSASAPTFAALISLLNNERLWAGKPTLGFLNPWLYKVAATVNGAFYDVTVGDNSYSCCGLSGEYFSCRPGWDPVTGVGTPNYNILRTVLP